MLQLCQVSVREKRFGGFGSVRKSVQAIQIAGIEGVEDVAHVLHTAAVGGSNLSRRLLSGTGEQVLSAPEPEGVRRAQLCLQEMLFLFRKRSNIERWFHVAILHDASNICTSTLGRMH